MVRSDSAPVTAILAVRGYSTGGQWHFMPELLPTLCGDAILFAGTLPEGETAMVPGGLTALTRLAYFYRRHRPARIKVSLNE